MVDQNILDMESKSSEYIVTQAKLISYFLIRDFVLLKEEFAKNYNMSTIMILINFSIKENITKEEIGKISDLIKEVAIMNGDTNDSATYLKYKYKTEVSVSMQKDTTEILNELVSLEGTLAPAYFKLLVPHILNIAIEKLDKEMIIKYTKYFQ